ncbi:MAG TPA: deoxyribonuclease IV [Actinomycetes bacterium]|nr:deoxyribonuclease IV [Actinomycetes bacterium]
MRIGAHVSVAGGLGRAVGNARDAGCESLQVFVSNARGWAHPLLDPPADGRFRADLAEAGLGPLFVHAPYLVNFASASPVTRERSRDVVAATLAKAAATGAAGVVVHAGQALASGRAAGLATSREALLPLADAASGLAGSAASATGPDLVLELTAGTRGALAARFEDMAELLAACGHHPRLKVCMDTCHAQAAGYDLGDPAGAVKALDELFATLGGRVVLVHANDSRDPVGAGRDRHCPIGTGTIGDQGFAAVLAHPGLAALPVITETTGDPAQMAADLTRLHRLRPTGRRSDPGVLRPACPRRAGGRGAGGRVAGAGQRRSAGLTPSHSSRGGQCQRQRAWRGCPGRATRPLLQSRAGHGSAPAGAQGNSRSAGASPAPPAGSRRSPGRARWRRC